MPQEFKFRIVAELKDPAGQLVDEPTLGFQSETGAEIPKPMAMMQVLQSIKMAGGLQKMEKDGSMLSFVPIDRIVEVRIEASEVLIASGGDAAIASAAAQARDRQRVTDHLKGR